MNSTTRIAIVGVGIISLLGVGVIIGLLGIPYLRFNTGERYYSSTEYSSDIDRVEKLELVEESLDYKVLYVENRDFDPEAAVSFKLTLRNVSDEDFTFDMWHIDAAFLDSDRFAVALLRTSTTVTIPANDELEYTGIVKVPAAIADQIASLEVRGV